MVDSKDFSIVEGYLRLLKRNYFGYDMIGLHATDLFERTYMKYRRLVRPVKRANAFLDTLQITLKTIPISVGIYHVDKDEVRKQYNYKPAPRKNLPGVDMNIVYQKATLQAFYDFANYLEERNAYGEVIVESRFGRDGDFMGYFDLARKKNQPGNVINLFADIVHKRINSVKISNKKTVDSGLEVADLISYCTYRNFEGDPGNRVKLSSTRIQSIYNIAKQRTYLRSKVGKKLGVKSIV